MSECYIIDTSSLLSYVRYYHPFDENKELFNFMEEQFAKNFILLNSVYNEAKQIATGVICKELTFLKEVGKVDDVLASKKDHNCLRNNWSINTSLNSVEFDNQKNNYIKGADFQIIAYAQNAQNAQKKKGIVVTEETKAKNDSKLFKKIPLICDQEKIKCITLPTLFKKLNVKLGFLNLPLTSPSG